MYPWKNSVRIQGGIKTGPSHEEVVPGLVAYDPQSYKDTKMHNKRIGQYHLNKTGAQKQ